MISTTMISTPTSDYLTLKLVTLEQNSTITLVPGRNQEGWCYWVTSFNVVLLCQPPLHVSAMCRCVVAYTGLCCQKAPCACETAGQTALLHTLRIIQLRSSKAPGRNPECVSSTTSKPRHCVVTETYPSSFP